MPTVPVYERRVNEAPLPDVRMSPEAPLAVFGGGPALNQSMNAAHDLFTDVGEYAIKERQRADEVAVQDADMALSLRQSELEQRTSSMMGINALESQDSIKQEWSKHIKDVESSLKNDNQKAALSNKIFARSLQLDDYINKHVSGEMTKYDDEQTASYITNSQKDAAVNAYDRDRIESSFIQQLGAIDSYGKRTGKSPEFIAAKKQQAIQQTNLGIIDRMISDENINLAESYVNGAKDSLSGDQVNAYRNRIKSERRRKEIEGKVNNDTLEKELFLRTLPGDKNPLQISELTDLARSGQIDRTTYDTFINRLTRINDDPTIPSTEKTAKLYEIADKFTQLNGGYFGSPDVDEENMLPVEQSKGNRLDDIKAFRKAVSEAAPYLTKEQERAFYMNTQTDLNDSMSAKVGIMKSLFDTIKKLGVSSPASFAAPYLNTLSPSVSVQKAAETAQELKEKAVITKNPNRSRYQIGQILTNSSGLKAKVIGFDANGDPQLEAVK